MLYETIQGWYKEADTVGRAKGKIEGEYLSLITILEIKFGKLKVETCNYINSLDSNNLITCIKRSVNAKTLDEVLKQK
jgi:hypothetical protein